jgi:hypothetical protein
MPNTNPTPDTKGPVKVDPLNPAVVIPVYAGGDGPPPAPEPADRGDDVEPPKSVEPEPSPASDAPPPDEVDGGGEPEATDAEAPGEPAPKKDDRPRNEKGQFIPRSRFNEVNEERKRLQERLEQLEAEKRAAQQVEEDTYDFDAKEEEYANLVLDGKIKEAISLRKEIRAAEQKLYEKLAQQKTLETTHQLTVEEQINDISSKYASAVEAFDPDSESYNDELLADLRDIYAGALESGRYASAPAAFEASIKKALRLHGIADPFDGPQESPAQPKASEKPAAPQRTAQKRVEAIAKQPPSLENIGGSGAPETHATIDVTKLTDAELAKLPEATRRRLRGDFV